MTPQQSYEDYRAAVNHASETLDSEMQYLLRQSFGRSPLKITEVVFNDGLWFVRLFGYPGTLYSETQIKSWTDVWVGGPLVPPGVSFHLPTLKGVANLLDLWKDATGGKNVRLEELS